MGGNQLLVIGLSSSVLTRPPVTAALEAWTSHDRPRARACSFDDALADPKTLDGAAVVWVLPDEAHPPETLFELLAALQERHLLILVTAASQTQTPARTILDTVVCLPADAQPREVVAALSSLWSASKLMRALRMELSLLELHQGGLCDQIDKIDEELRLAAQLQQEFLPRKLPDVGPLSFGVLYRPAGYVSGDIYDVERLDENHVAVFIADAVGHGVPAALLTMYIKRSLQTRRLDPDLPGGYEILPPDEALAKLNRDMLAQQSGKVRFATACYGVINVRSLQFAFARAGHPFPMLLRADGSILTPEPQGPLLGVFQEAQFESAVVQLEKGDRLLMYSDGFELAFPESAKKGGKLDLNAYRDELAALATGTIQEAMARLEKRLDEASGSLHQRDDMTTLLVAVTGEAVEAPACAAQERAA